MKKIENIIEVCWQCRHCHRYVSVSDEYMGEVRLCGHRDLGNRSYRDRLIQVVDDDSQENIIPDWCPLETYKEVEKSETRSTIILPGMPHLEWMTENLSGYGGTEIDGRWYYTWEEAMAAAELLGNGWRLPIDDEFVALDKLGSTWDAERKGRWFGANHGTDHEGSLFLPAAGCRTRDTGALSTNVGTAGYVWSSSSRYAGDVNAGYLNFSSSHVNPLNWSDRAYGFSVRCVRNRQ